MEMLKGTFSEKKVEYIELIYDLIFVYLIGRNKLTEDYEKAVWRARNIAAPQRAKQLNVNTPCAEQADRCYDCKSPGRICRGLVTLWGPMMSMEAEVLLIDEDLGL